VSRVCFKDHKLFKLTESGKVLHTLIALHEKKNTLTSLNLDLYNLYACCLS